MQSLKDTLVIKFAQFISEWQEGILKLTRCEDLYKEAVAPTESELKWRRKIPVLVEPGLEKAAGIQRCADFFLVTNSAKFCSDSCRVSTYQIEKQIKEAKH